MRRLAVALAIALAASSAPSAGATAEAVAGRLRAHAGFLADDALRGRDTGTAEYEIAARYVAAVFAGLGLEPAGDGGTHLQQVPYRRDAIDVASARVVLHRDGVVYELAWGDDFVMSGDPVRPETTVTAPAVFVGYGVSARELGHDDYAGVDVAGKIVVLLRGAPASLPHNERAYYSSGRTKRETAAARGAVGVISLRTAEQEAKVPWERIARNAGRPGLSWRHEDGRVQDHLPQILGAAELSHAGGDRLFAGARRSFAEVLAAEQRGEVASFALPVEVTLARRTVHSDLTAPNVAALLPGSDPGLAGELVIYSAHLDHVGVRAPYDGDNIYNGLYDNALGTAVLLEVARAFVDGPAPRRSVLFLAVGGEEHGLLGSDYFAHFPTRPELAPVANVNLDMPLFLFPLADVIAFGAEHSSLEAVVQRAAAAVGWELSPDPMPEEVMFVRSDQYSFVRRGVPAVFLVTGRRSSDPQVDALAVWQEFLRTHYHMPSDEPGLPVDWPSAARFVEVNWRIGLEVANAPAPPAWNGGDFFGERFAGGD